MNCIIVEDDGTSRKIIEGFIGQTNSLNLVGSFDNAPEALEFMKTNLVEIAFLDVEMPDMSGLDMLDSINSELSVVFITSKEEYAAEAFEKDACDYIVKPVTLDRFKKSVVKVQSQTTSQAKFIFVKSNSVLVKLSISDIDYIESIGDYVGVHVSGKRYVVHTTMKDAETKLPPKDFCRIHRSYIINFNRINQIEENTVSIEGKTLPVSRTYRKNLMSRLKTF